MTSTQTEFDRISDRLRALSDQTRMQIVMMLAGGEHCQREIAHELATAQPLLSFHLKILRDSGLVRGRRRGRWVFYALCRNALTEVQDFLGELNTPNPSPPSTS
jgi:ArsR family transcriptional regulator